MYFIAVLLLTVFLPVGSALAELHYNGGAPVLVVGRWFVFWAIGVRLALAGLRQVMQPAFTAKVLFEAQTDEPLPIVQELGFANLAMSAIGLISLGSVGFLVPAAMVGVVYYGLAGAAHLFDKRRTPHRTVAMITDIFVFLALAACVVSAVAVF